MSTETTQPAHDAFWTGWDTEDFRAYILRARAAIEELAAIEETVAAKLGDNSPHRRGCEAAGRAYRAAMTFLDGFEAQPARRAAR